MLVHGSYSTEQVSRVLSGVRGHDSFFELNFDLNLVLQPHHSESKLPPAQQ